MGRPDSKQIEYTPDEVWQAVQHLIDYASAFEALSERKEESDEFLNLKKSLSRIVRSIHGLRVSILDDRRFLGRLADVIVQELDLHSDWRAWVVTKAGKQQLMAILQSKLPAVIEDAINWIFHANPEDLDRYIIEIVGTETELKQDEFKADARSERSRREFARKRVSRTFDLAKNTMATDGQKRNFFDIEAWGQAFLKKAMEIRFKRIIADPLTALVISDQKGPDESPLRGHLNILTWFRHRSSQTLPRKNPNSGFLKTVEYHNLKKAETKVKSADDLLKRT